MYAMKNKVIALNLSRNPLGFAFLAYNLTNQAYNFSEICTTYILDDKNYFFKNILPTLSEQEHLLVIIPDNLILSNQEWQELLTTDITRNTLQIAGILVGTSNNLTPKTLFQAERCSIPIMKNLKNLKKIQHNQTCYWAKNSYSQNNIIIVNPSKTQLQAHQYAQNHEKSIQKTRLEMAGYPCLSKNGVALKIGVASDIITEATAVENNHFKDPYACTDVLYCRLSSKMADLPYQEQIQLILQAQSRREDKNLFITLRASQYNDDEFNLNSFKESIRAILLASGEEKISPDLNEPGKLKILLTGIKGITELNIILKTIEKTKNELIKNRQIFNPNIQIGISIDSISALSDLTQMKKASNGSSIINFLDLHLAFLKDYLCLYNTNPEMFSLYIDKENNYQIPIIIPNQGEKIKDPSNLITNSMNLTQSLQLKMFKYLVSKYTFHCIHGVNNIHLPFLLAMQIPIISLPQQKIDEARHFIRVFEATATQQDLKATLQNSKNLPLISSLSEIYEKTINVPFQDLTTIQQTVQIIKNIMNNTKKMILNLQQTQISNIENSSYAEYSQQLYQQAKLLCSEILTPQEITIGGEKHTIPPSLTIYNIFRPHLFGDFLDNWQFVKAISIEENEGSRYQITTNPQNKTAELLTIKQSLNPDGSIHSIYKKETAPIVVKQGKIVITVQNKKPKENKDIIISGLTGTNNLVSVLQERTAAKAIIFDLMNNKSSYSIIEEADGKPKILYFNNPVLNSKSATKNIERMLHNKNFSLLKRLLLNSSIPNKVNILDKIEQFLYSENLVMEINRESILEQNNINDFGTPKKQTIMLANWVNYYCSILINTIKQGGTIEFDNGLPQIILNGRKETIQRINANSDIFRTQIDCTIKILHQVKQLLQAQHKKRIENIAKAINHNNKKIENDILRNIEIDYDFRIPIPKDSKLKGKAICYPLILNSGKISTCIKFFFNHQIADDETTFKKPLFIFDDVTGKFKIYDQKYTSIVYQNQEIELDDLTVNIDKSKKIITIILNTDIFSNFHQSIRFRFAESNSNSLKILNSKNEAIIINNVPDLEISPAGIDFLTKEEMGEILFLIKNIYERRRLPDFLYDSKNPVVSFQDKQIKQVYDKVKEDKKYREKTIKIIIEQFLIKNPNPLEEIFNKYYPDWQSDINQKIMPLLIELITEHLLQDTKDAKLFFKFMERKIQKSNNPQKVREKYQELLQQVKTKFKLNFTEEKLLPPKTNNFF